MGTLEKILQQFLTDPSYQQFKGNIQKGIAVACHGNLTRKIYPPCRKMITQQCLRSMQNIISPIRNGMVEQK